MEDIRFFTEDGFQLPGTLFESTQGHATDGPVVLISSATAVPRAFYARFAQYVADNGARAVLTYDYRGIGTKLSFLQSRKLRMSDWAIQDLPAAVRELRRRYRDAALVGLGHSFGGQALGLSGIADRFARYMTIAAGSGYLGHTREAAKLTRSMNLIGLPVAAVLGTVPKWAGMGEPLPFGAFNQWRRWCNSPNYFFSDPSVPQISRFADVHIPMIAVGFEDDPWATRQSVEALIAWYSAAPIKIRWFTPEEAGAPIGHFGFFRKEHREFLWPQIVDWLTHAR
jgi:predicted alpha/beta hydrolase